MIIIFYQLDAPVLYFNTFITIIIIIIIIIIYLGCHPVTVVILHVYKI